MDGTVVLAICLSKIRGLASGIKKVEASADGTKLIFTCNDAANTKIPISIPNPVVTYELCNKLSVDTDNYLLYDGKRVSDFTDDETALLKKFSVVGGKLKWNGQDIGSGADGSTADWTTNIACSGLASGVNLTGMTALEILKKITRKYTNANCTVTWSETNTLFEKGDVLNLNVSVSNFVAGDYSPSKISLYRGSTLLEEKTASGTVTFSTVNNITTDTTFTVKLTDANNIINSVSNKTYKFVYPSYTGSCANIPTSADVIGMTKLLREKAVLTQGFTASNSHLVFASPKSYGTITSIKDPNNFENLTSFIKVDMTINGVDYYVYYTKNKITCTNFKYTFNY